MKAAWLLPSINSHAVSRVTSEWNNKDEPAVSMPAPPRTVGHHRLTAMASPTEYRDHATDVSTVTRVCL